MLAALVSAGVGGCDSGPTQSVPPPTISLEVEGSSLGPVSPFSGSAVSIRLREDTNAPISFWFSFLVRGGAGRPMAFHLQEAFASASPATWALKRPVASDDGGATWVRIADTAIEGTAFVFRHQPVADESWIALTLPYNHSRWTDLVDELDGAPWVQSVENIGASLDGVPIELIHITDPSVPETGKTAVWAVARQHPGEPEGSYMLEGFLEWLLGDDPAAEELRRRSEVYVVGFLNPDGVLAGNQRVNRAGLDLNRTWANPDPTTAPTIVATQREILSYVARGGTVRILVDFHAAPGGRSNFFFYNDEAGSSPALHGEIVHVMETAHRLNPDIVSLEGSEARTVPSGERARNWAFVRLGTHGLTVEASSNDVTYGPFAGQYVTEERLLAVGAAVGSAVAEVLYGIDGAAGVAGDRSAAQSSIVRGR